MMHSTLLKAAHFAAIVLAASVPCLAAAATTALVAPSCEAAVLPAGPTPLVQYDPFEGVTKSDNLVLRFSNGSDTPCTIGVAVESERAGNVRNLSNGGENLQYRIETQDGLEVPNDRNAIFGAVTLPGGRGREVALLLRLKVAAGTLAHAGRYEDRLVIRAYDANNSRQIGTDITRIAQAEVQSRAQVNLAGASGSFQSSPFGLQRLDFGTLETGATRVAFVQVRATGPVGITVSSQYRGRLQHTALQSAAALSYTAQLDGQELPLQSESATITRNPPLTLEGLSYPLSLRVTGDVSALPAGEYRDVLTVNVTPR